MQAPAHHEGPSRAVHWALFLHSQDPLPDRSPPASGTFQGDLFAGPWGLPPATPCPQDAELQSPKPTSVLWAVLMGVTHSCTVEQSSSSPAGADRCSLCSGVRPGLGRLEPPLSWGQKLTLEKTCGQDRARAWHIHWLRGTADFPSSLWLCADENEPQQRTSTAEAPPG